MNEEMRAKLLEILEKSQVSTLAVLVEEAPLTGLLPFVVRADMQAIWIHASDLARHTRGLEKGAPFSLLIHSIQAGADPLQTPRVSLQGTVARLERDTPGYQRAQEAYVKKYPQSEMLFSFQDFNLYELQINGGRFVAGFAQAISLTPNDLAALPQDRR